MGRVSRSDWRRIGWWALLALLGTRLLLMAYLPLTDTTEARYAEIARKMLETGNWITLQHDYGVPFWAKPPLSSWLVALSTALFGSSEFAVRLPSLLLSLGTLALTADLARRRRDCDAALATALVLAGSLLFFIAAGAVMTDAALVFGTTLSLAAFWHALNGSGGAWPYLFFVGLGLGLLAKGPIAVVLVGLQVIVWVMIRCEWRLAWRRLPWLLGPLLTLAMALPWYLAAEMHTPGFLRYFLLGEHLGRFLDAGWQGDLYGFAHASPRGIIWLYTLAALLPWCLYAPRWWYHRATTATDGWSLYLLLWTLTTPVFFTLSSNVIFPYALPMLPGAALLLVEWRSGAQERGTALSLSALSPALLCGALLALQAVQPGLLRSQKAVIAHWQALRSDSQSALVYWERRRAFSAEFYSAGRAKTTYDEHVLGELLSGAAGRSCLVLKETEAHLPPAELLTRFEPVSRIQVAGDWLLLLRERETMPTEGG